MGYRFYKRRANILAEDRFKSNTHTRRPEFLRLEFYAVCKGKDCNSVSNSAVTPAVKPQIS